MAEVDGLAAGATIIFSIKKGSGADETGFGVVQSSTIVTDVQRVETRGPDGDTYAIQEFDRKKVLTLSYAERATQSAKPEIGNVFSYKEDITDASAIDWYIDSISSADTVDGVRIVDLTATHYPNLGTPDA